MNRAEHQGPQDDREGEWRLEKLAVAERPAIGVRRRECSVRADAGFAVELAGISRSDDMVAGAKAPRPFSIGQVLAGVDRHQRLTFIYSAPDGTGPGSLFAWTMAGCASADTESEARESACRLWRDLILNLTTLGSGYRFAPAIDPLVWLSAQPLPYLATLRPAGVHVASCSRPPIGFSAGGCGRGRTLLIAPHPQPSDESMLGLARSLARHRGSVRISLTYAPLVLGTRALDVVTAAKRIAARTDPHDLEWETGTVVALTDAGDGRNSLDLVLDGWLRDPRGYRVSCEIAAAEPIPSALVSIAGSALFGQPVCVAFDSRRSGRPSGARILDLRACANICAPAPRLLPTAAGLLECGLTTVSAPLVGSLSGDGLIIGRTRGGLQSHDVRLGRVDRTRHTYLCGATGSGKSTLLCNMAMQDIERGEGVCVIDPHGDLYRQLLASLPRRRSKDVIVIDPCDPEFAVGINFLECRGPNRAMQMNFVTNELIRIFDRLYDLRETGGPIFEQYMRNAAFLVMDNEREGGTVLDIPALFEDETFRKHLKETCRNPLVERFWTRQAERAGGGASLANTAPYVTSKLNQFTTNAVLRPIVGQPQSTIDFRLAMDEGRIVLVNLSRGLLGELDTQLLGMLLVGQLFSAALSRAGSIAERRPFFVYVDEFQHFTTDTIAHVLSESRKFGLALTLANQTLSQLLVNRGRQNVLDAVLGNCGTIITFRLGTIDAERLETYTKPEFQARDLQDLPDFHAAARLLVGNRPTRPFVLETLPTRASVPPADVQEIVSASRLKYARPIAEVEREILSRRGLTAEAKAS